MLASPLLPLHAAAASRRADSVYCWCVHSRAARRASGGRQLATRLTPARPSAGYRFAAFIGVDGAVGLASTTRATLCPFGTAIDRFARLGAQFYRTTAAASTTMKDTRHRVRPTRSVFARKVALLRRHK